MKPRNLGRARYIAAAICVFALQSVAAGTPSITTWRLDSTDIRSMAVLDFVLARLEHQRGIEYSDTFALMSALETDLAAYPQYARMASSIVRTGIVLKSETVAPELDSFGILPALKIWMDSGGIVDLRRRFIAKAGMHPIPGPLLKPASGLVGVEFPTRDLLHAALRTRLARALGRGRYAAEGEWGSGEVGRIDSLALDALVAAVRSDSADLARQCARDPSTRCHGELDSAERLLGALETVRHIPSGRSAMSSRESAALEATLTAAIGTIYDLTLRVPVEAHATKRDTGLVGRPPRWSGEGCGCSRDASGYEIYGFHAAGAAGSQSGAAIQRIDFEVLQRIEYFGLTFDRAGDLVRDIPADSGDAFLREARAHGTRVDWVVTQTDPDFWASVTPQDRTRLFARLRSQILSLLGRPSGSFWERVKARIAPPRDGGSGWGDGVTLQFPSYPSTPDAMAAFDSLYRDLLKDLAALRPGTFHLNLVFPAAGFPSREGFGSYEHVVRLLGILDSIHSGRSIQDRPSRILILMDEPSEVRSREIQRYIDMAGSAQTRRRMGYGLVPVLFPQTRSASRFRDNVVYLHDTYSAMGVWPLPTLPVPAGPGATAQDSLSSILWEYFGAEEDHPRQSRFEAFACVHRWGLWSGLVSSLIAAVLAGVVYLLRRRRRA